MMIRLDKYLAQMGCGTRQEVKKYIRKGMVSVGDRIVKNPEYKVSDDQSVYLNGARISYTDLEYFLLNKPAGVVSATEDKKEKTVLDLIGERKRKDLFPVGRLDKDTEGLLLITNNGALAHQLLSPKKHVDKLYFARVAGRAAEDTKQAFLKGVNIGTREEPLVTLPARLEIVRAWQEDGADYSEIRLVIREGKFHQVKRMFQAVGMEVLYLRREAMGPLKLEDSLACGAYRRLTEEEVRMLKEETEGR